MGVVKIRDDDELTKMAMDELGVREIIGGSSTIASDATRS